MDSPILHQVITSLSFDVTSKRPVYLQVADALLHCIQNGQLRSGQKLPSTREVAKLLDLNRITISKAYEELGMQGWLNSHVGRGTFVSDYITDQLLEAKELSNTSSPKRAGFAIESKSFLTKINKPIVSPFHLDDGFPDPRMAPLQEFYRAYRNQLSRSGLYQNFGSYNDPAGPAYYRQALSDYLNETRRLNTTPKNIFSVRGTLMGLNLVCNALIIPGDIVVSGIPGWKRAEHNFLHAKAQHIGIPVDEHGLVVDELAELCKNQVIRMVYVNPHHHYPTTVPLRLDRRLELLRLANKYQFIIFEDDYDFDFHYKRRPLLPLASSDENGMVIYCGSFSKSFSPAFRMGYLVAAENVIEHLAKVRILLDRQGDHILDNAMAELLNDGTIHRYLRKALHTYEERRDLFCDLLTTELNGVINFKIPEGGMSVWGEFDNTINLEELAKRAQQKGLALSDGKQHHYPNYHANAIRLGFASSSPDELITSIQLLKSSIN